MLQKITGESFVIDTPVGHLSIDIETREDSSLLKRINLNSQAELSRPKSQLGIEVVKQVQSYFGSAEYRFDLPLLLLGTEYQQKVWKALSAIPSGQVLTYGKLAEKMGSSARAIGNACRNNPIPIVIPCHRVVAIKNIGGFSGETQGTLLNIKKNLLSHEGLHY